MVEVTIWQMAMDEKARIPVVILREKEGRGKLPIWIGTAEAGAIAMEIQGKSFQRPMTHDLLLTMLRSLRGEIRKVEIPALREQTYFARVIVQRENELFAVDARPSDSLALAVRAKAPIFVARELLNHDLDDELPDSLGDDGDSAFSREDRAERLRRRLEDLRPEDFGRYSI
jgi:hypothetical protein